MAVKFSKTDENILYTLADHLTLTVLQLSLLTGRNLKALRRRLAQLRERGVVELYTRGYGRSRGRPEDVVALTSQGAGYLLQENGTAAGVRPEIFSEFPSSELDHNMLVNWFRIHLQAIEEPLPFLKTSFLAPTSPFLPKLAHGKLPVYDRVQIDEAGDHWVDFIPDGVFTIKNDQHEAGSKSLLFFLEVDMGTESLASPSGSGRDIRQKILNYQSYFRSQRYKRYEEIWNCRFTGFRVLFLANSTERESAICRLVQEMPPNDFIWVTGGQQMFEKGLGGNIWARGGKNQGPPQSILGPKLAIETPVIDQKT